MSKRFTDWLGSLNGPDKTELEEIKAAIQQKIDSLPDEADYYWKPKLEELYWFLDSGLKPFNNKNNGSITDDSRIEFMNCFPTQEQAQAHADFLKRNARKLRAQPFLEKKIKEWSGGWVPYWDDAKQFKFCFAYNHAQTVIRIEPYCSSRYSMLIYFPTFEIGQRLLKEFRPIVEDYLS